MQQAVEEYNAFKQDPANVSLPVVHIHGHHIVFKKGDSPTQRTAATKAKDVLFYYGIDPSLEKRILPSPLTGPGQEYHIRMV